MSSNYFKQQKTTVKQLEESLANGIIKSTVVDMQKDYENDGRICLTSVTFVPNNISKKIILDITTKLQKIEPWHYYLSADSFHLTIKNIKNPARPPLFTQHGVTKVDKLFKDLIPKFQAFEFSLEDVIMFPTSLALMAYSNDKLKDLVVALDDGLKQVGVPDNKKYFSDSVFWGNITFCRFTSSPGSEFIKEVNKMINIKIGSFKVKNISLITCNSVCSPKTRKTIGNYQLHG